DVEHWQRKIESPGHDTHHRVWPTIERDLVTNNCRIGVETPLPQSGTDDNDIVAAFRAFILCENATSDWLDTEQRKKAWRYDRTGHTFGNVARGEVIGSVVEGADSFEACRLLFVV